METEAQPLISKKSAMSHVFAYSSSIWIVAVGYLDPGNWAADLQAGMASGDSAWGLCLMLFVLTIVSGVGIAMQCACIRLVQRQDCDLATACRLHYHPVVNYSLWAIGECGLLACELGNVAGMALGWRRLLNIPMTAAVAFSGIDLLAALVLSTQAMQRVSTWVMLVVSFGLLSQLPHSLLLSNGNGDGMNVMSFAWATAALLGSTVMPHNLYLHTSLQMSQTGTFTECIGALSAACLLNGIIVGLGSKVKESSDDILGMLLATAMDNIFIRFAIAIAFIAAGWGAGLGAGLAGEAVLCGHLGLTDLSQRHKTSRRVLIRSLAVIPTVVILLFASSQDKVLSAMLVASQVFLGLVALPCTALPLIRLAYSNDVSKESIMAHAILIIIIAVNVGITVVMLSSDQ